MTATEKSLNDDISGKVVFLKAADFVEMKKALTAAWQLRNQQLSNIHDETSHVTADVRTKWRNEFRKWFDLDNKTNSVGKPVIIREPDGSWTNANVKITDDEVTVVPDYSRPFTSDN